MDTIGEFWTWWPVGKTRIEAAITDGNYTDDLIAEIGTRVNAIDEELDWELAAGDRANHAFCLSAGGDPEKRLVTEVWKTRAPAADATWEFHAARKRGDLDNKLAIGDVELSFTTVLVAFELDDSRERADVTIFHPVFPDASEELAQRIALLALDTALGEDGVERWVGSIDVATELPEGARPIAAMVAAIDAMAATATGEQFAILRGEDGEGAPLFVTLNLALKRIDHLMCTEHVSVELKILAPDPHGLAIDAEAQELDAIEDTLGEALGRAIVYYGRETRRGRRVLHYFAPEDSGVQGVIERWAAAHPEREVATSLSRDPTWEVMRRFS